MIDWKKLRREIRILAIAAGVSLFVLAFMYFFYQQTAQQYQQAKNQLSQAQLRYQQASENKKILDEYNERFNTLQKRGVFGDEQRIDWIETLQASSDRHKIPSVKFDLAQRGMIDSNELGESAFGISVFASSMKIEMNLLHEGDLFALLADFDTRAKGLNASRRCQLVRDASAGLSGYCELDWISITEPREEVLDENGNPITDESMLEGEGT